MATEEDASGESGPSNKLHPLLVDTVLHCIFNYEPVEVLKQCRLVCRKWKLICDPVFVKRAMFVLTENENDTAKGQAILSENSEKDIKFSSLFKSIQKNFPFTAFKFQYNLLTRSAREIYFEPNKMVMTQLAIHNTFSLDDDVEDFNINNLIGPKLNRLILTATFRQKMQVKNFLSISLDKLSPIPCLDMYRCTIILDSKKMTPKELKLTSFLVEQNDRIAQFFPISELIDFSRLTKLHLKGFTGYGLGISCIKYSLNFSDCANVKYLTLIFIRINLDMKIAPKQLSLHRCVYFRDGSEIKQFVLNDFLCATDFCEINISGTFCSVTLDFEDNISVDRLKIVYSQIGSSNGNCNRITIKDLEVEDVQVFDLSILPSAVEKLKITFSQPGGVMYSNYDQLPKLRQLMLFEAVAGLSRFVNCHSLYDVALSPALKETLVVEDMPPNIKRLLLLHNVHLEGSPREGYHLDVLALSGCHSSFTKFDLRLLFDKLRPAALVFCNYGHYNSTLNDICEKSVEIILDLKRMLSCNTVVAFGPVKWDSDESFLESSLRNFIDQKAKYYLLVGLTAEVIDKATFSNMIPFV